MLKIPADKEELFLVAWLVFLVIVGTKLGSIGELIARLLHRRR
jgi:hypothetical protein